MTGLDQAANAILIVGALSIPFIIVAGVALADRSRLGRARIKEAIRQIRGRKA